MVGCWGGYRLGYGRSWSITAPPTPPLIFARDHGAQVVYAPQRGYGVACHAGLLAATASVVAVMDADASLNPRDLDRVVAPIMGGTAVVIGSRRPVNAAAFP